MVQEKEVDGRYDYGLTLDEEPSKKRKNDDLKPQPKSKRKVRPQEPLETSNSLNP